MARVLIVEDSVFQRTILKRIVQQTGHETVEAASGREALRKIDELQPDLIFLDLLMPDINGFQVLQVLVSKFIKTPVVVVTADVQETTREKCRELGVKEIVNKPVSDEKLVKVIDKYLGSG
ncbi:response regulator [Desulfonatronospira sp.]|uniref:response regulator n=1 Tax=Desulfonatronospira sp. TaxID=1962951 RepID=UPI0025B920F3|nr:response regulator [Desulfonatronospira sp.]